ncbi:MAG: phytanoyl-CoA dioxygenase family protein [Pseudomonadota bacterium]
MTSDETIQRYLAAAHIKKIPEALDILRWPDMDDASRSRQARMIDAATELWCAADDDPGRAEVLAALPRTERERGVLQRVHSMLDRPHRHQPPESRRQALATLGVGPHLLTEDERHSLDQDGYVILGPLLDAAELAIIRATADAQVELEGATSGHEVSQTRGIARVSGTVLKAMNRGGLFDVLYLHPTLLSAVAHVLGDDFKVSSSNFHCPLPGYGHQMLHADWGWGVNHPEVVNVIWMLDEFTLDNGPTRVVPGSHRWGRHPAGSQENGELIDLNEGVPEQHYLTGQPGCCVVYNAHLWHSGTQNVSHTLRRAQHLFYTRGDRPTQTDTVNVIDEDVRAGLQQEQRALLDVPG